MQNQVLIPQYLWAFAFDIIFLMEQLPDFQEPRFIGDEAEVTPRIRILRALARMIARDLLNSRHDDKDDNNTMTDDLLNRVTHD